jgi:hypothetical protein
MPILTTLVVEAPTSGYLAGLFLNVVESSPRAALLPFVVRALEAWCVGYGIDPNFWSEKDIGSRVCAWIIRALDGEAVAPRELVSAQEELLRCLDTLIRSGVAQAREVEDRISSAEIGRKSA